VREVHIYRSELLLGILLKGFPVYVKVLDALPPNRPSVEVKTAPQSIARKSAYALTSGVASPLRYLISIIPG
jgi:hypothetical protein